MKKMLPKQQKISRIEFPSYKEQKSFWVGVALKIQTYKEETKDGEPKFAVVVAKKMSKSAVERNTFKRKLFSIIRLNFLLFKTSEKKKYIIFPNKRLSEIKDIELEKDIQDFIATMVKK